MRSPNSAPRTAAHNPAKPPPIITRSKCVGSFIQSPDPGGKAQKASCVKRKGIIAPQGRRSRHCRQGCLRHRRRCRRWPISRLAAAREDLDDDHASAAEHRHVMTTARTARRKAIRLGRRSSVGDNPVRPIAPHPWLTATAGQRLDALSARPAVLQCLAARRCHPILFPQCTIPATPAAAESP